MVKTNKNQVINNIDMMYHISTFLQYKDKCNLSLSEKNIYLMKPILFKIENKAAFIITSFFRKCKRILDKIEAIHIKIETMKFHDIHPITTSETMALYYFKYYDSKFIKSWYNGLCQSKRILVQDFIDTTIDNPSKYDLYRLQIKMPLEAINQLGW